MHDLRMKNVALYAASTLRAPPKHSTFAVAEHHQRWADHFNAHPFTLHQASRGIGKTLTVGFAYPLWMAERYPKETTIIFGASEKEAQKRLRVIRREVMANERLSHLLPSKSQRRGEGWSASVIRVRNGHEIEAVGWRCRARGNHPRAIVMDDVVGEEAMYSESIRDKDEQYFDGAVINMLEPGGEVRVIGTPLSVLDLYARLEKSGQFFTDRTPVMFKDEAGKWRAQWPERFSLDWIGKRRRLIGEVQFAREYMCVPASDESTWFPPHLFEAVQADYPLGAPGAWWRERGIQFISIGCDFAISTNVKADYSVFLVMGVDGAGVHWVLDVVRVKGVGFQEQLRRIRALAKKYGPDVIACESNHFQRIFPDELVETGLPVHRVITGKSEKHSLEVGLPSLRVLLENELVRAPWEE